MHARAQCHGPPPPIGISMTTSRELPILSSNALNATQGHSRQQIWPTEEQHFFGEEWHACCRQLHIVQASRIILIADLIKLFIESVYFISHIGFLDATACLQISWAILGTILAIPAIFGGNYGGERFYKYLWPIIALKMAECIVCLFVLLLIFVLGVSGPIGYTILRLLIKWKYRRVEDDDAIAFSLGTFLILCILLMLNCYVLHTHWRLRNYLRSKAMFLYLRQRNQAIRALRPSFFLIPQ